MTHRIRRVTTVSGNQLRDLAELLIDCVDGGASVSFMHPLSMQKALAFWGEVADGVGRDERALLVAEDDTGIIGTVQLVLAQPENQPHRADLAKMLVHRRARRQGLGEALLRAAEQLGRDCGKTLLVLDTVTGSDGERLYTRVGWQKSGIIPDYALWPRGGLCATTYFYRVLGELMTLPTFVTTASRCNAHLMRAQGPFMPQVDFIHLLLIALAKWCFQRLVVHRIE